MNIQEIRSQAWKKARLRDKPLHFHYMPADEEELMKKLHDHFDFAHITRELRAQALLGLVTIGVRNSQFGHFTSFSAREGWYTGRSHFYGGPHYTYSHIDEAFKTVRDNGMFIELRMPRGTNNKGQSVYMATPELIELVADIPIIEKPRATLQVKNDEKVPIIIPDNGFSIKRRKDVEALNEWYAKDIEVSFDVKYHQFRDWYWIEGQWKQVRPVYAYCTFNRSSWDCGGRLYSWATNLNRRARRQVMLNGDRTIELDFKNLHPTMLFAMNGKQIDRDVYSYDNFDREFCKVAFLAVLNGTSRNKASYSLVKKNPDLNLCQNDAVSLLKHIEMSVPELTDYFYSDVGVKLQRKDSDIIISCLNKLKSAGIPALSVHDSLVVPGWAKIKTERIMLDSFSEFFPGMNMKVELK